MARADRRWRRAGAVDDRGPRRLSNEKAERELGWQPRWRSWREGFREALTDEQGPAPFPEAAA